MCNSKTVSNKDSKSDTPAPVDRVELHCRYDNDCALAQRRSKAGMKMFFDG